MFIFAHVCYAEFYAMLVFENGRYAVFYDNQLGRVVYKKG
jgi:hypothetical protein